MPRLPQSRADKQYSSIQAHLDAYIGAQKRAGNDLRKAAQALGLTYTTLFRRRARPQDFTLKELQGIANTLNIRVTTLLGEKELET